MIERSATFSRGRQNRLTLVRAWSDGPRVCFIGLNPSTADEVKDDPTVCRWAHFAKAWGYAGFVAVNLYPFRTSSPAECRKMADWEKNGPDWYARDDIQSNLTVVAEQAKKAGLVVACWGAADWAWHIAESVRDEIHEGVAPYQDIYCFGKTASGAPIHPMARGRHRVPDDAKPVLCHGSPA